MDDICLSPELDGTFGVPTFEHSGAIQGKWPNSECKLGTKCKCLRKHQEAATRVMASEKTVAFCWRGSSMSLCVVMTSPLGTPRGRYDECSG
jgi:hypothetical protein